MNNPNFGVSVCECLWDQTCTMCAKCALARRRNRLMQGGRRIRHARRRSPKWWRPYHRACVHALSQVVRAGQPGDLCATRCAYVNTSNNTNPKKNKRSRQFFLGITPRRRDETRLLDSEDMGTRTRRKCDGVLRLRFAVWRRRV